MASVFGERKDLIGDRPLQKVEELSDLCLQNKKSFSGYRPKKLSHTYFCNKITFLCW